MGSMPFANIVAAAEELLLIKTIVKANYNKIQESSLQPGPAEYSQFFQQKISEVVEEELSEITEKDIISAAQQAASRFRREVLGIVPEPHFCCVEEFVDDVIAVAWSKPQLQQKRFRWCPRWWAHPEAVMRFNALWNVYEQLRVLKPATFMDEFLVQHAEPHMRFLTAEQGPFSGCLNEHTDPVPLESLPRDFQALEEVEQSPSRLRRH